MQRLFVFAAGPDATPTAVANPEIEWLSEEAATAEEGCLSIPGIAVDVERAVYARVRGQDLAGEPLTLESAGLEARVLQHEIDHLDGVLMLDRTAARAAQGRPAGAARGRDLRPSRGTNRSPPGARSTAASPPDAVPERTVFFGTSDFAATVLRVLAVSPYRPQLVVTPPDSRQGRGRKPSAPPAAVVASGAGIELLQTEDLNGAATLDRIGAAEPTVGIVCAFGQIIREPLLSEPEMLNVHPSLLPRWRGAAPIERAIISGDAETGVTIMRLAEGLDSGPIALQERTAIEPHEDFASLSGRLAEIGAVLMLRALELHERGELELAEQDDSEATYAEKVSAADRRLDPARSAVELERVVRALTPHVGAYLELDGGDRLGVREARAGEGSLEPGALKAAGGALLLGCGEGVLALGSVQPPGGRPMPAEAYLRGHDVPRRAL